MDLVGLSLLLKGYCERGISGVCLLVELVRYDEFQGGRGIRYDDGGDMSS